MAETSQLAKSLAAAERKLDEAQRNVSQLSQQVIGVRSRNASLVQTNSTLEEEKRNAEVSRAQQRSAFDAATTQLTEEAAEVQVRLDASEARNCELEATLANLDGSATAEKVLHAAQLSEASAQHDEAAACAAALTAQLSDARSLYERSCASEESERAKAAATAASCVELEATLAEVTADCEAQLKAAHLAEKALRATVAAENKVEAKAAAALKTTLRTQQAKTAQLRGKLASVEIEMEKLTAQCLETEQRFSAAKAEVGEARAAARALDTTPKVCVQVHVAADAAVSHTEEETSLRDENAKLRAENARLLGHHNTHQRIHYVQKMKKENVLLAAKLEEEREGSRKLKKILKAYQTASTLEVVSET